MESIQFLTGDRVFFDYQVATMTAGGPPFGLIPNGLVVARGGQIAWLGPCPEALTIPPGVEVIPGRGRLLTPGLIDCHTHLVFAGSRANEFGQRLTGASYESIARRGGGILSTVRETRQASEEELYKVARRRAESLVFQGVTTLEIKSGYGLDLESELKILRVAVRLANDLPLDIVRTVLAAHCVPPEFTHSPDDYVRYVCDEILPATEPIADAVDVFCDAMAFGVEPSRRVLERGLELGLAAKIHAEQRSHNGGAAMAARLGAISADHLEYLDDEGVEALAAHGTVATLLPGAFYFLREQVRPPVERLREMGVPMALASDFNPGSSPVGSLQLIINMGCTLFGLTPEEAVAGVTRVAARALRLENRIGTLETGKQADLVDWDLQSPEELAYRVADNSCRAVFKRGERVHAVSF